MDAMTLCLRYERASKTNHDSSDRRRKHASKVSLTPVEESMRSFLWMLPYGLVLSAKMWIKAREIETYHA